MLDSAEEKKYELRNMCGLNDWEFDSMQIKAHFALN